MPYYGYLVVEGPTDVEFVARVLKTAGLVRIRYQSQLDPFWIPLIPPTFPYKDDLLKRVPVPMFLSNATHTIAIHSAQGLTRMVETVQEDLSLLPRDVIQSIGFVLDADTTETPNDRFNALKTQIGHLMLPLTFPQQPGQVQHSKPNTGAFVMPDNHTSGTLETVLLECAQLHYPQLLSNAQAFVNGVDSNVLTAGDLEEFSKPAGRQKTLIGSIANVLKPGKSVQVSIQDNRWVNAESLQHIAALQSFWNFLDGLLSLSSSA